MKDFKKQIESAASLYSHMEYGDPRDWQSYETTEIKFDFSIINSFIEGAKSEAARAYHTEGMYSEEEVKKLALLAAEHAQDYHMKFPYEWFDEWFEQNKKL